MGSKCCRSNKAEIAPAPDHYPQELPISIHITPKSSLPVTPASRIRTPKSSVPVTPISRIRTPKSVIPEPIPVIVVPLVSKRPPTPPEPLLESPFSHTGLSKTNPLRLIRGYEKEPLVSLEEALAPFDGRITHLEHYIHEAKSNCFYPSNPKLTLDESAAIYIYTLKWGTDCIYDQLQNAFESNQVSETKPWFKYLKLFKSAVDKLPDASGEIWQGKENDGGLQGELSNKTLSLYTAMDIFSSSKTSVEESLSDRGIKNRLLIRFKFVGGKLVGEYTVPGSGEVLVWSGAKVGVSDLEVFMESGLVTVHVTGSISKQHQYSKDFSVLISFLEPKPKQKPPTAEAHYVCFNPHCENRCGLKHDPGHCYGFDLLHFCEPHCSGPKLECFKCGDHKGNIYECKKCKSRYCEGCCFQEINQ